MRPRFGVAVSRARKYRLTTSDWVRPAARLARCWGLRAFFSVVVIGRSVDHLFPFGKAE